jgi:hypothetical protein
VEQQKKMRHESDTLLVHSSHFIVLQASRLNVFFDKSFEVVAEQKS